MATRHRIDEAQYNLNQGDVEKYFNQITNIIEENSGVHDFKMISHDCSNTAAPFRSNAFTEFKLTDTAMDIVDISKGFITMKVSMDVLFLLEGSEQSALKTIPPVFFIGFKSAAHIIEIYNVFINGVMTNCKQNKSKHEQVITYNSKARSEKIARPGMYSPHENVQEMSECVCGAYLNPPAIENINRTTTITFDIVIQVDDLLPFSAFQYFPRYLCGDFVLQLSASITQNMVFCLVDHTTAIQNANDMEFGPNKVAEINKYFPKKQSFDHRFHQCGDYVMTMDPYSDAEGKLCKLTIIPSNLIVHNAKSYVHGFNIKSEAKQNIANMFSDKNLVIPAQWVDHYTFSQLPSTTNIRTNLHVSMFNACQIIMTFPNSGNQLTVSRNPHLEAIQCQVSDRIVPDKFFSTLDKAHAEMILESLNLDSLFEPAKELVESLTKDRGFCNSWSLKIRDDSDYMLVINLERYGNGCFCDGITDINVPVNFQANYINSTRNPHYYDMTGELHAHNINLFIVSDAFWVFNEQGGQFIKDINARY